MKRFTLALVFAVVAVCGTTTSKSVSAQEILLEGPLAGAPAVRKLVQYRKMRFSIGPQFAYTIVNKYMHNFLVGAELGFNFTDWFGVGLVAYYGFNLPTKLTKHIGDSNDISGDPTTPTDSNWPSYTGAGNFEEQVARLKGMYLAQLNFVPFRGKASLFEKLFVAIDGTVFVGGGVVHFEERKECETDANGLGCGFNSYDSINVERETKFGGTFTWGLNFTAYVHEWAGVNVMFRMTPFKWNAGGTDESGQAAEAWEVASVADGEGGQDPAWQSVPSGGEGDYPDGKINKDDRDWNLNMSIGIGAVFVFPTTPSISD
jgi:hypothetical protein